MKRAILLAVLIVGCASVCPHADPTLSLWSATTEWNQANAAVVIPANTAVKLDVGNLPKLDSIEVSGTLVFDNIDLNLDLNWLKVNSGGKLIMGSTEGGCSITSKIVVTFYGPRDLNASPMGNDPGDGTVLGSKGLAVAAGGTIEIHGLVSGKSWTRLSQSVAAGSKVLYLQDSVSWQAGDQIVIASTDFGPITDYKELDDYPSIEWSAGIAFPDQTEVGTIASVSGNTVHLVTALNYSHYGVDYESAEIGLLTRKIVFRGDDDSLKTQFGAHLMLRQAEAIHIEGAEFTRSGQQGLLGRYPIHFHFLRDVSNSGFYVKDCSIHDNFQRCFTVHETSGILVQNNVAYNTFGHCYFLENGGERANVFKNNLGIRALPMASENPNQIIPSDVSPSIFWITNPNNTWINNAAVGGRFAYWFSLPTSPIGAAAPFYVNDNVVKPRKNPLGIFDGNVGHGSFRGLHIDDMLNSDGTTTSELYCPTAEAIFTNLVMYKNRQFGVWGETCGLRFSGLKLLSNSRGIMSNGISLVENSLIVGETANIGTPLAGKGLSRSYPDPWGSSTTQLTGHESYDNGGPQASRNNVFVNFTSTSTRPASGIAPFLDGPFMVKTKNRLVNLTFQNANQLYLNYQRTDNQFGVAMLDLDGSVTGLPYGGWLVSNQTTMLKPYCAKRPEWNGYMCPPFPEGYVQVTLVDNLNSAPISNGYDTSNKGRTIRANFTELNTRYVGVCQGGDQGSQCPPGTSSCYRYINTLMPKHQYAVNFVVNEHFVDTPSDLSLQMQSSSPGDWIIVAVPYPTTAAPFDIEWRQYRSAPTSTKMTSVCAVNQLSDMTYYYDEKNEFLYLKFENKRTGGSDYTNIWGLTYYEDDLPDVRIKASCTKCTPKKTTPPVAIALINPQEELYQTELVTSTKTKMGIAFVTFNPHSVTATYSVYHKLTSATFVGLYTSDGKLVSAKKFVTSVSPVKGVFKLSRDQWDALATNSLTVGVSTSQSKYLTGKLTCQGTCTPAPVIPASDPCNPNGTVQRIYDNTLMQPWADASWGVTLGGTLKYNSVEKPLCGSSSIKITLSEGGLAFRINTKSSWMSIDSVYQSLEFFIKLDTGYEEMTNLVVSFGNGDGDSYADVALEARHIQNFVIDEFKWTRVRISLAEMKVVDQVVARLVFYQTNDVSEKVMFIDEIRLTSEAASAPFLPPCDSDIPMAPYVPPSIYPSSFAASSIYTPDTLSSSSTKMISILVIITTLLLLL